MKKLVLALFSFLPVLLVADTLPSPDSLFTRLRVQDYTQLKDENGRPIRYKYILTFDRNIRSDDGVFWANLDGKIFRGAFRTYFFTVSKPTPHFIGVDRGKPTNQVIVLVDPEHPAFSLEELKGSEILVFTIDFDPLPQK